MRLGDLDTLKKTIEDEATFIDGDSVYKIINIINNAPPVETDIEAVAKDAYEQGYTDGWKERFGEPDERPEGEWIFLGDNPNRDNPSPSHKWSCNKCGRGVKEQENFCPNCGAKMGGGME